MEEIKLKELDIDYYKKELQTAIKELHEAQEEIKALESEIDDQNAIIRNLRTELDEVVHEDEVVITTKHKISYINIGFEEVYKR